MKMRHTSEALVEASQVLDYYCGVSDEIAERFLSAFDDAAMRVIALPGAWPKLAFGMRRCGLNGFPYSLVYRIENDEIVVYAWLTRSDGQGGRGAKVG